MAAIDKKIFSAMGVAEIQLLWGTPIPFKVRLSGGRYNISTPDGVDVASINPEDLSWVGDKDASYKLLLGKRGMDTNDMVQYLLEEDGTMTLIG